MILIYITNILKIKNIDLIYNTIVALSYGRIRSLELDTYRNIRHTFVYHYKLDHIYYYMI